MHYKFLLNDGTVNEEYYLRVLRRLREAIRERKITRSVEERFVNFTSR